MTKGQSQFFRLILFLIGLGIVALAFYLINGGSDYTSLSNEDKFMWISIAVMYLFIFFPFFFSSVTIGNFSGKIPSLTMIWVGISLYTPASIVVIYLLKRYSITFNIAVIIQAVFFFLFILNIYFGYFASSHARGVAVEEAGKLQYLTEMKSRAASLALKAGSLSSQYEQVQKALKQSSEDIRYLSPVDEEKSTELDLKIIDSIESLVQFCDAASEGGHPAAFDLETKELQMLIKERKLLRN
jgi:hypothetical protein